MQPRSDRRKRPPLDAQKLSELALSYVGRYATTRAKLRDYLLRKLRERGWSGSGDPPIAEITARFAAQGYVDDAAFALSKSRDLSARGYGSRRVEQALRVAGVGENDGEAARELSRKEAVDAALRFAQRRRFGPYAGVRVDPKGRERALAAMLRAGHPLGLARAIVDSDPGVEIDRLALAETAQLSSD